MNIQRPVIRCRKKVRGNYEITVGTLLKKNDIKDRDHELTRHSM